MTESNSQPEKPKDQRRFSQEQYDFLRKCSKKGEEGIEEWNEWRKKHSNEAILLEGADLNGSYLRKANLASAYLFNSRLQKTKCHFVDFEGATLLGADLRGAHLYAANLKSAKLGQESEAVEISFQSFRHVLALPHSGLDLAADLRQTILWYADLSGAELPGVHFEGADFRWATLDGATIIRGCKVDRKTDFREVSLSSAKIDGATKQLLEYNIRRKNWEEWYKQHKILKWPVWLFWSLSDYGLRTSWIIAWFFGLAVAFAAIYYIWGLIAPPGIIENLFEVEDAAGKVVNVPWWLAPIRAVHFSVVIMTVGFTNMHANAHSFWAHVLVGFQMILGFVLLGALVTRFAVLFTAGGPAGKFADEKKSKGEEISQ